MNRRKFLATLGIGGLTTISGCINIVGYVPYRWMNEPLGVEYTVTDESTAAWKHGALYEHQPNNFDFTAGVSPTEEGYNAVKVELTFLKGSETVAEATDTVRTLNGMNADTWVAFSYQFKAEKQPDRYTVSATQIE